LLTNGSAAYKENMKTKKRISKRIKRIGCFEYGYIRKPSEMLGTMYPHRPHWWIQHLGNGLDAIYKTKRECFEWMKLWDLR
jgi:hypothetical protein